MNLEQLDPEYCDDQIAEAMYQREKEWWHYQLDRANFTDIAARLGADSGRAEELLGRIAEIDRQVEIVEAVYSALRARIRSPEAHAAAVERNRIKREAAG